MRELKKFKYSMETVLDYRKDVEQAEKMKFNEAKNEYVIQKSVLEDLEKKLENAQYIQLEKTPVKLSELKSLQKYIQYLEEKVEAQRLLVAETEKRMDKERELLVEAQKERKIVEKHKEKSLEKHMYQVNSSEQKSNDEFALYSHLRK